jgi:tetratricopeptide (TPR) repeat protein
MNEIDHDRFTELLHAYELGMLSDAEEEDFELYLMQHPEQFEQVERLDEATLLLRHDPEARATIRRVLDEQAGRAREPQPEHARPIRARKFWPRILPATLAVAAVILIVLLANWHIEIGPTPEAIAVENRLAIMSFENLVQPDDTLRLGEIMSTLLITDLSESKYMQVVSSQRLYDLIRLMGDADKTVLDRETAMQVAREAQARWMLTGSILQMEPYYIIAAQLIDMESGTVRASQRVTGEPGENIFAIVDKLTVEVKNDITLPREARHEPDRSVAEVTTHSPEAYRCYLEGRDLFYKYYKSEAARCFERALDYDSTFAMAYYYLAQIKDWKLIDQAVRFAGHASRKEQIYISFMDAAVHGDMPQAIVELKEAIKRYPEEKEFYYYLGVNLYDLHRYDEAIVEFNQAIAIDPLYKSAHNILAYTYNAIGDYEKAIQAINAYISLAPGEANPYDSRGEIYADNGKLDLAIESYKTALEIKPNYEPSLLQLGALYLYERNYREADSCYQVLATINDPLAKARARYYRAIVPLAQGKYKQALHILSDGIAADSLEHPAADKFVGLSAKLFAEANIYSRQGNMAAAIRAIEDAMAHVPLDLPNDSLTYQWFVGQLYAEAGQAAKAREVADKLKILQEKQNRPPWMYWYVTGAILLADGQSRAAVGAFERAAEVTDYFFVQYMLARAYLAAGDYDRAAVKFEEEIPMYAPEWRLWLSNWRIEMRYYLGLAYEKAGRLTDAATQYRTFLEIWSDADSGNVLIDDARARLDRLTAASS